MKHFNNTVWSTEQKNLVIIVGVVVKNITRLKTNDSMQSSELNSDSCDLSLQDSYFPWHPDLGDICTFDQFIVYHCYHIRFHNWHYHIIVLFLKVMVKLLQLPQFQLPQFQQQQVRIVFFSS